MKYVICSCGKRGFETERDAEKAMGRARAKRKGQAEGTLRGAHMENRVYLCIREELWHLTSESRRRKALPEEPLLIHGEDLSAQWEAFLAEQAGIKPKPRLRVVNA